MLVKRYIVADMPEALAKIRQELGKDAIILSSKRVRAEGIFGLLGRKKMEVIAALNEQPPGSASKTRPQAAEVVNSPSPVTAQVPVSVVKNVYVKNAVNQDDSPASLKTVQMEEDSPVQAAVTRVETAAASTASTKASESVTKTLEPAAGISTQESLVKEVREMRSLLLKMLPADDRNQTWNQLRETLAAQDVKDTVIEEVLDLVRVRIIEDQNMPEDLLAVTIETIRETIETRFSCAGIHPQSKLVAFVGPTGVGKTTTIAKIAADQVLHKGRTVALLTTDTYRIAAVEQLRTYANILKIPMQVIYGVDDLKEAIAKYADFDLLLLDSAGRNYANQDFVNDLNEFLEEAAPDETYLVLSLTSRRSVLSRIANNFAGVGIDRLLFTKLDETDSTGAMFSLAMEFNKGFSYVTTGQNVPDDIQILTPETIAKLTVGEKVHV